MKAKIVLVEGQIREIVCKELRARLGMDIKSEMLTFQDKSQYGEGPLDLEATAMIELPEIAPTVPPNKEKKS